MSARGPQLEMQLTALASAADRANRPTGLVGFALLLLACAGLFALVAGVGYARARTAVASRVADAREIARLVGELEKIEASRPDFKEMYPPYPTMGSDIEEAGAAIAFSTPPTVNTPSTRPASPASNSGVNRIDITCRLQNEPLEQTLQWVSAVLRSPFLKDRVFVSHFEVTPTNPGWRADITFSRYEFDRSAQ